MDKVEKESSDITVGKCSHHFYFCNNFVKPPCIFIFFRHADTEAATTLPTYPDGCSYPTMYNER